jgi:hypothetical protein
MDSIKEQMIKHRAEYIEKHKVSEDGIALANTVMRFLNNEEIHHTIFGGWTWDNTQLDILLAKLIEGEIFGNDIFADEMVDHLVDGGDYIHVDNAYEHVCDNPPDRY